MYLYIYICVCIYIYNISCSTSLPNNSCVDGFTSIYFYGSNHHLKELGWLSSTKLYGNADFFITITLFF